MANERKRTQAMPQDDLKGAPDGVNTQAQVEAAGAERAGAYSDPKTAKAERKKKKTFSGFLGHGGQSNMGYHGTGQLGGEEVEPGGNPNAGAKTD